MSELIRVFTRFFVIVSVAAGIIISTLYFLQNRLIFPAPELAVSNFRAALFEHVSISTIDNEELFALYRPPGGSKPTIIVLHGNGDAAILQTEKGRKLVEAGFGVLLLEYRGYPGSTGEPSEQGLFEDARAAYSFLQQRSGRPIGIYAHSLGTGVAVKLASEKPIFALVLESPFDSLLAVAQARLPWIPMKWLLKHQFNSDQLIGKVDVPILIMHGNLDAVIPIEHGQKLAGIANSNVTFLQIEGAGHNNLANFDTHAVATRFFSSLVVEKD